MKLIFETPDFWARVLEVPAFRGTGALFYTSSVIAGGEVTKRAGVETQREIRLAIRKFLFEKWPGEFDSLQQACDLSRRPIGITMKFSISHTQSVAGVLVLPASVHTPNVGLDIEVTGRVRDAVAARVSAEGEAQQAPSPTHLWAAKEAFYKCLPQDAQPADPKRLKISDWASDQAGLLTFTAELSPQGATLSLFSGAALENAAHVYSFVIPQRSY